MSISQIKKERIVELDVLRGLAFLAVVLQHVLGVYSRRPDIPLAESTMIGMLFNVSKFAVPAFVFVSGIVLIYNYYDRVNYFKFIKKRSLEIFVPYVFWTVIYNIYYQGIPEPDLVNIIALAKHIFLGTGAYHLWFVIMLFQFYLLYPVLLKIFKLGQKWSSTYLRTAGLITLAILLYTFLMWFSSSYIPAGHFQVDSRPIQMLFIEYRSRNFLFYIFYFILGGIAAVSLFKWRKFILRSFTWNSFLFLVLFIWVGLELMKSVENGQMVNLNYSTSLKPSMFFYTLSEILLLYGLSLIITNKGIVTFRWLDFIGKFSYGAYLAHALLLNYVVRALNYLIPSSSYLLLSILAFILCSAVSVFLTYLISKIPYGKIIIGPFGIKGHYRRDPNLSKMKMGA